MQRQINEWSIILTRVSSQESIHFKLLAEQCSGLECHQQTMNEEHPLEPSGLAQLCITQIETGPSSHLNIITITIGGKRKLLLFL